ncbi:MAG: YtxH domain-containing protein [Flavitalea sp.]
MTTSTKVMLGLIGAAAAGAIIGMLVAPDKGSEMRRKVKDTASDWADQLTDLFAEGKTELSNLKNKATKAASTARAEAENRFNDVKESYS